MHNSYFHTNILALKITRLFMNFTSGSIILLTFVCYPKRSDRLKAIFRSIITSEKRCTENVSCRCQRWATMELSPLVTILVETAHSICHSYRTQELQFWFYSYSLTSVDFHEKSRSCKKKQKDYFLLQLMYMAEEDIQNCSINIRMHLRKTKDIQRMKYERIE
jgi:hypothetical protein